MRKPQYRRPARNLHALGLSDEGADVNAYQLKTFRKRGEPGEPALIWAADYGTPSVVRALLARGANVHAKDWSGRTALHFAAQNGRIKNVRLLLAAKANANAKEMDGYTPLMGAQPLKTMRLLLNKGAKVNAQTKEGWTALMDAILSHSTADQVGFLLANGANIHARNNEGQTALMLCTRLLNLYSHEADLAKIKYLLDYGAKANECDNEGKSPLWYAVTRLRYDSKAVEVVKLLLEAGAEADGENGKRLLDWCKKNGYGEAAELLAMWRERQSLPSPTLSF